MNSIIDSNLNSLLSLDFKKITNRTRLYEVEENKSVQYVFLMINQSSGKIHTITQKELSLENMVSFMLSVFSNPMTTEPYQLELSYPDEPPEHLKQILENSLRLFNERVKS